VIVAVAAAELALPLAGRSIKGNRLVSGERIYHVPRQRYYHATRVNWLRGERYF
jgi:hypothetical protein